MFTKRSFMCHIYRLQIKKLNYPKHCCVWSLSSVKLNDALFPPTSLFNCTARHLINWSNDMQMGKPSEISHFWEQYSKGYSFNKRCVNRISDAFDCSAGRSKKLISEHPRLFLDEIDSTMELVDVLLEYNLTKLLIRNNVWLLYFNKSDLVSRLNAMKRWNVSDSVQRDMIVLLKLPLKDFYKVTNVFIDEKDVIPCHNRVMHMAQKLECSVKAVSERLVKNKYLLTRDVNLIDAAIDTYLEYGIRKSELLRDTWSLKYTEPVIRRRLNIAKAEGILQMKTWFVRCSDETFQKVLETQKIETTSLQPFRTREEYLSHKLEMDIYAVKRMMEKETTLRKTNITKLINVISFLFSAGYKGFHICSCPRIFQCSIDTIVERVTELKDFNLETPSLHIILKAENEYQKVLDRIMQYSLRKNMTGTRNE